MAASTTAKARSAGAKTPTDRKTEDKKVRRVRVLPDSVKLEWDGDDYELQPDVMDDVELILALEQNRQVTALVQLLGNQQWERFKVSHRGDNGRVPYSEAEAFLLALTKELQKVSKSGN